jgi:hypothetical protein
MLYFIRALVDSLTDTSSMNGWHKTLRSPAVCNVVTVYMTGQIHGPVSSAPDARLAGHPWYSAVHGYWPVEELAVLADEPAGCG